MIVKGTKQLGSFKRGINIYVPTKKGPSAPPIPPAPAGIPIVTDPQYGFVISPYSLYVTVGQIIDGYLDYQGGISWGNIIFPEGLVNLTVYYWGWELVVSPMFGGDFYLAANDSTDNTKIPTTGWYYVGNQGLPISISVA